MHESVKFEPEQRDFEGFAVGGRARAHSARPAADGTFMAQETGCQ